MSDPTKQTGEVVHDEAAILEAFKFWNRLLERHPQLKGKLSFDAYYMSQDLTVIADELETLNAVLCELGK